MSVPGSSPYVVVGAGIHGLSTAYHLAKELRARGAGSGADVVVLDKTAPGAGASGIACGVVRNNYFQPAMSELMQACVEVWESDPEAYHYNAVGYIALGAQVQEADLAATFERQERIGYRSELVTGEAEVDAHMKALFPDWRAKGVTVCLHEHQGGFAFNIESVLGLRDKCVSPRGCRCSRASRSPGSRSRDDDVGPAVETSEGDIEVGEQVVVAPGPWARASGRCSGMPDTIDITHAVGRGRPRPSDVDVLEPPGGRDHGRPAHVRDRRRRRTARHPPRHGRSALHRRGRRSSPTSCGGSTSSATATACRAAPHRSSSSADVELDPYPRRPMSTRASRTCGVPALSHSMSRFEGCRRAVQNARSGGVGAFTADNFPVFDYVKPNVYGIFDSNHGYKMIGVGREVAKVVLGDHSRLLYPFRFERFATGDLHPVSSSPYPWS